MAQKLAFAHAVLAFGADWRWMAFIDVDEILFPTHGGDLTEVLSDYLNLPSVAAYCSLFGYSGHVSPPDGLVIENYTMWAAALDKPKSIVNPSADRAISSVHLFDFDIGDRVGFDENRNLCENDCSVSRTNNILRLNHYYTRSKQEFVKRLALKRNT